MRKKKRVFKKLTIRLSLWEFVDIDELRKEFGKKTLSGTLIYAGRNYKRLRGMLYETQNELDILRNEKNRQQQ